ncbi:MAG: hypothetical protein KM310_10575 [Clostridiales bacterium]|nr:hypothetical protein [Clostridiales bacterium]
MNLDEKFEPAPEDYVIYDAPGGGYDVGVIEGEFVGSFKDFDEALAAIRAKMDREKFWPNVWLRDDHGGMELLTSSPE